jgi:HSP20 family protein
MDYDDDRDKKRRKRNPFDFMDEDEFERIFDEIQKMFESGNFKDIIGEMMRGGPATNKRFIHGFSLNIGPDGKPKIQEFGNRPLKTSGGEPMISEEREPLTDIIEGDEDVAITVEIPGVEREDIDLNATNEAIEIKVDTPQRKYHKKLDLPCDVLPKTTKATYKNGILDIVIKRKEKKKPGEGYRVNIE